MKFQVGEIVLWTRPNNKVVMAEIVHIEPNSYFAQGGTLYLVGPLAGEDTLSFHDNAYSTEKFLSKLPDPNEVIKTIV